MYLYISATKQKTHSNIHWIITVIVRRTKSYRYNIIYMLPPKNKTLKRPPKLTAAWLNKMLDKVSFKNTYTYCVILNYCYYIDYCCFKYEIKCTTPLQNKTKLVNDFRWKWPCWELNPKVMLYRIFNSFCIRLISSSQCACS